MFFFIFSSCCLHSYYFTIIFLKTQFFRDTWAFLTVAVYYKHSIVECFLILILQFYLLTFLITILSIFFIFSFCCLHSYYFTVIFQKLTVFVTLMNFLLFLFIILVFLLDIFIILLYSYISSRSLVVIASILTVFCIIMQKLITFLWHLSISNCCCLLFILFYSQLFHSYTSVWSVITLVNILIVFLHHFYLLFTFLLFYCKFFKNSLLLWHLSIFDSSYLLFLYSYLIF